MPGDNTDHHTGKKKKKENYSARHRTVLHLIIFPVTNCQSCSHLEPPTEQAMTKEDTDRSEAP